MARRLLSLKQPESAVGVWVTQSGVGPNFFLPGEIHSIHWLDLLILTYYEPKHEHNFRKIIGQTSLLKIT